MLLRVLLLLIVFAVALAPRAAEAQETAAAPAVTVQVEREDTDADLNLSQPDFMVVTLPTTLRLPRFKSAFRVTHRFTRPLGQGDFGNLAEDFFGLDTGAVIGLEYRFGLARGWQAGIYRTSDRTIEFFTQYNVWSQANQADRAERHRLDRRDRQLHGQLHADAGGRDLARAGHLGRALPRADLGEQHQPVPLGSRRRQRYVHGRDRRPDPDTADALSGRRGDSGHRLQAGRVARHASASRSGLAGTPSRPTFPTASARTMGQIARGGIGDDNWYLGFSISRKFF